MTPYVHYDHHGNSSGNKGELFLWWSLRGERGEVCAIAVVYVDDFLLCGPKTVVKEIAAIIQAVWDTSELASLGGENSIRFLGMELQRETETSEVIHVFQQGYIWQLLRAHEISPSQLDKVPITKELATVPDKPESPHAELIKKAQQVTGEALWVAQTYSLHNINDGDNLYEEPLTGSQDRSESVWLRTAHGGLRTDRSMAGEGLGDVLRRSVRPTWRMGGQLWGSTDSMAE